MAKIGVSLKINQSQIDAARLFSGKKGNYLDATIFIELDELDQYGNSGMITQDVSKEEKDQGIKGNILGNGKVFWVERGQAPQQVSAPQPQAAPQQAPKPMAQQPAPMPAAPQAVDHSAIIGQYQNLDRTARTALWTTLQPAQQTAIIEALG